MPRDNATSANVQLARALGVEVTGLRTLVLTLRPGHAPLLVATYLVRDGKQVAETVRRLELVCVPATTDDKGATDAT